MPVFILVGIYHLKITDVYIVISYSNMIFNFLSELSFLQ